ncbi:MAG TPA: hypothetical protein VE194_12645, partial [Rubrobacter sp.]|nr:hypothetical protein [Rubrobacter sp.]
ARRPSGLRDRVRRQRADTGTRHPEPRSARQRKGERRHGSTLAGVWQLNEDDQGYCDDLAFTYRRASRGDG